MTERTRHKTRRLKLAWRRSNPGLSLKLWAAKHEEGKAWLQRKRGGRLGPPGVPARKRPGLTNMNWPPDQKPPARSRSP